MLYHVLVTRSSYSSYSGVVIEWPTVWQLSWCIQPAKPTYGYRAMWLVGVRNSEMTSVIVWSIWYNPPADRWILKMGPLIDIMCTKAIFSSAQCFKNYWTCSVASLSKTRESKKSLSHMQSIDTFVRSGQTFVLRDTRPLQSGFETTDWLCMHYT